jgi:hypothetical protein
MSTVLEQHGSRGSRGSKNSNTNSIFLTKGIRKKKSQKLKSQGRPQWRAPEKGTHNSVDLCKYQAHFFSVSQEGTQDLTSGRQVLCPQASGSLLNQGCNRMDSNQHRQQRLRELNKDFGHHPQKARQNVSQKY